MIIIQYKSACICHSQIVFVQFRMEPCHIIIKHYYIGRDSVLNSEAVWYTNTCTCNYM